MSIFDFFTREAGQERRRALEGLLTQFIPPEMRPQLGLLAEAQPIRGAERAGQGAVRVMNTQGMDRVQAIGDTLSEMAGVVAPAMVAGRAGVPVANAVQEVLTGYAPAVQPFLVDEFGGVGLPGPADPAIQRAEEVLSLIKSGRADEVTEGMLAMDDPVQYARMSQHLWDNYDLPMDFESRMARASNWPTPLVEDSIHGTLVGKDYTSFKGDGRIGQEVYVAPNTDAGHKLSAQFSSADQGRIMPLRTPAPLDTSALDDRLLFEQLMDDKNRLDDFRMKGGYRPSGLPGWGDQWAIDTVNEAGIPALKLHERDWVTSTAIFDPRNIRSRFARFDPRLSHLRNLNAAMAAGVPLGLLAMQPQEEQY